DVAPTGRLFSFTVQEHQLDPEVEVPYTIVLVELDDAPDVRLLGHLPGAPDLALGQPMVARFDEMAPGVVVPQWETAARPAEHTDER
ncbi:MAG TPA: OB-fold domain-containing protein, partial [Acidimicrobiia bacterium]